MSTLKIAIDGPAGAGKSTIARAAAKALGYVYIDTGAMYRAVALKATRQGIDTRDSRQICTILDDLDITIKYKDGTQIILLDGQDVTADIRLPEISKGASEVAAISDVRMKLVEIQRQLATNNNVIMDGRDIGTYVLPDADLKIFLTASIEERAIRRYTEMIEKDSSCSLEEIKQDIIVRDEKDRNREFAPLKVAEDAIVIDTTGNDLEKSIEGIINIIKGI